MKIVRVTPIHANHYLYVEIETDTGLVGLGESAAWGHQPAVMGAMVPFADYLLGKDPAAIEHHWNVLQQFGHFRGAAIGGALSAIDVALWDLRGQALGVPIHGLLGGPVRQRVRLYPHVKATSPADMVAACRRLKALGFTAIGHLNPFLDEDPSSPYFKPTAAKLRDGARLVAAVREAVGDEVDLCIEIHRRLTPAEAIAFAHEIAPFRPMFYEDPIPPESIDAMAMVAQRIPIPIATGERLVSLWEFQALVERRAAQFLRSCVGMCGGITGTRKIAALAEAHNLQVVPHNPMSPVSLYACLQIAGCVANVPIVEFPCSLTADGWALPGQEFADRLPKVVDGFAEIPTDPGLGIRLRRDVALSTAPHRRDIAMRPHRDGFVANH